MQDYSIVAEGLKATPVVAVSGLSLFGYPLPDVIQVVTLVYLILQLVLLAPRIWKVLRGKGSSTGN